MDIILLFLRVSCFDQFNCGLCSITSFVTIIVPQYVTTLIDVRSMDVKHFKRCISTSLETISS